MAHSFQSIAEFTDGETRLVYAARTDDPDGPLEFLADGTANAMRAYTKANLQCFVPDCPTPQFTTVSRRDGRDGFRHLTGGGHSEESLFHKQGKHALLDWLKAAHPDLDARPEVSLRPEVDRRADILTTFSAGQRVALEVQYSSMDIADTHHSWRTRTEDYQAIDVAPVWFFGHRGAHFTPIRDDEIALGGVTRAVLDAGLELWWLNPITGKVAIPYTICEVDTRVFRLPPTAHDRSVHLWIDDLNTLTLTPGGVHSARQAFLADQQAAYVLAYAAQQEKEERERLETAKRLELEAALQAELAAASAASKAARAATKAARKAKRDPNAAAREEYRQRAAQRELDRQDQTWAASPMRANVLARHGGEIPVHLDLCSSYGGIHAHRQHWQATAYGYVIHNKVGSAANVADCLAALGKQDIHYDKTEGPAEIAAWLTRLEGLGHLRRDPQDDEHFTVTDPPVELALRAALNEQAATARHAPPAIDASCSVCHRPLDSFYASHGATKHILCSEPEQRPRTTPLSLRRRRPIKLCKGCANPLPTDIAGHFHDGCAPWQVRKAAYEAKGSGVPHSQ